MTLSSEITVLLDRCATIAREVADPAGKMDWKSIPAKMAVYLLTDERDVPILLSTVGDLRAALQRRLADTPADHKSKRVEYGRICTAVHFRIVHSPFVANYHYQRAARMLFPQHYRQMISWRLPWYLCVDRAETHPRFRRCDTLDDPRQIYFGPIAEKSSAGKLNETLEDLFDLCRYYAILQQAPHGKACAYKEMGKCPAPCDGSISLEQYRGQIGEAVAYLDPARGYPAWRKAQEAAMKAAAGALNFETAGKIKAKLTRGGILELPPYAHLQNLQHLAYLILQPGQGRPWIEPYYLRGGILTPGEPVKRKDLPAAVLIWRQHCLELAKQPITLPLSVEQTETLALFAHHLFRGPDDPGLYLAHPDLLTPEQLLQAAGELLERRAPAKPMLEQSSDRKESSLTREETAAENTALESSPPETP